MSLNQSYKYAALLGLLSASLLWFAWHVESLFLHLLIGWAGIAFLGVAIAYAGAGPRIFGKRQSGNLAPLHSIVFLPYHVFNRLSLFLYRTVGNHTPVNQITKRVYLGCHPGPKDIKHLTEAGVTSVLDLTCEFSALPQTRNLNYLCIPTLDTDIPSLESLSKAANWIDAHSQNSPVYVHCALGHGRSAMVVAAYLITSGQCTSEVEAIGWIRRIRPAVGLHKKQIVLLQKLVAKSSGNARSRIPGGNK